MRRKTFAVFSELSPHRPLRPPHIKRRTFLAALGAGAAYTAGAVEDTVAPAASAPTPAPTAPMKTLLWCWDSRMTWDDEPDAIQTHMAAAEKAFPVPENAPSRTRRVSGGWWTIAPPTASGGVIVWGFLRDAHGGVAAARDLCRYARDHGVAILPGAGLCAYGGYYYDGDHPFNLDTYLRKHPERASAASEETGGRVVAGVLDPALEENRQWWRDGLEWMLETFDIAGVNYEMGDFIVNPSEAAKAARAALGLRRRRERPRYRRRDPRPHRARLRAAPGRRFYQRALPRLVTRCAATRASPTPKRWTRRPCGNTR